jgi:hypothetical protein
LKAASDLWIVCQIEIEVDFRNKLRTVGHHSSTVDGGIDSFSEFTSLIRRSDLDGV